MALAPVNVNSFFNSTACEIWSTFPMEHKMCKSSWHKPEDVFLHSNISYFIVLLTIWHSPLLHVLLQYNLT